MIEPCKQDQSFQPCKMNAGVSVLQKKTDLQEKDLQRILVMYVVQAVACLAGRKIKGL